MSASVLTDQMVDEIIAHLRLAVPVSLICGKVGISESTIYNWLSHKDLEYQEFQRKFEKARSEGLIVLHGRVMESALGYRVKGGKRVKARKDPEGVASAKWMLVKRCPQEYGSHRDDREEMDGEVKDGDNKNVVNIIYRKYD